MSEGNKMQSRFNCYLQSVENIQEFQEAFAGQALNQLTPSSARVRLLVAKKKAKALPKGTIFVPNSRAWIEHRIDLILNSFSEEKVKKLGFADQYADLVDQLVANL